MSERRVFLKTSLVLSLSFIININAKELNDKEVNMEFFMPEESEPHKRTWMSFVANDYIWSKKQIPEVKRNLALIAKTIAKYEPVNIILSKDDINNAIKLLDGLDSHNYPITLIEKDDPYLDIFQQLEQMKICKLIVMDKMGAESVAKYVFDKFNERLSKTNGGRCKIIKVEIFENTKNSGIYEE